MKLNETTIKVCTLAKSVGQFIQLEAQTFTSNRVEEKSFNQLVSYVDKTAEEKLVKGLAEILPEAGFLTEEATVTTQQKEYTWIIDPLDGTTNFIHQLPIYSISIALMHHDVPVIGVVFEPNRHELFYAWKDGGAFLNGRAIKVNSNGELSKSLLATGFPYYDFNQMQSYLNTLQHFLKTTRGMRRMGSAAVDLAYVSCGRFDGFFEYGLSPWDVAAGILLVQEAGGKVNTFKGIGSPVFDKEIVASSTSIYDDFFAVIKQEFATTKFSS
jgi:myo-inositol-1(or 4)-monophosphatase